MARLLFFFTVNLILVSHTFKKNTKSRWEIPKKKNNNNEREKKVFLFKNVKEKCFSNSNQSRIGYRCWYMDVLIVLLFQNVISITINYDRHFCSFPKYYFNEPYNQ